MSLCINPHCPNPENLDENLFFCQACGSELLIEGLYKATRLLSDKSGFARIYEIFDGETLKTLKVLVRDESKAVELFEREAKVLKQLDHRGIPKGEIYFDYYLSNKEKLLHCLVMGKVNGVNLQEWLERRNNRPIQEKVAINWLKQLINILHEVHQKELYHRDIKPSNIMLDADGQLTLIDFGIVGEINETHAKKLVAREITKYYSEGYAPLEQINGQAVPQSDFFALGRTFVYLLTGKHPCDLGTAYRDPNTDDEWNWRDEAPQISSLLADFIDSLMARSYKKRPQDTQIILKDLRELEYTLYPNINSVSNFSTSKIGKSWQNIVPECTLGDLSSWHSAPVKSLAISNDGMLLASGSADHTIKVWNLNNKKEVFTLAGHGDEVNSVAISPSQEILASGSSDKTVRLWSIKSKQQTHAFSHSGQVMSVAFDPNGQTVLSGSGDKTINVWNLANAWSIKSGRPTHTHARHSSGVTSIAISPNGQTLVSGSYDKTVIVWTDHILTGHSDTVRYVVISPNGDVLASGSQNGEFGEVKIWNLKSGELIHTIVGHKGAVSALAISPDGKTLVSGSLHERIIRVWDIASGRELNNFQGHLDGISSLVISPDGQHLISGSKDGTIKMWCIK
ncbi:serine/threonine protein kinase [Trichocoleus desertorum AS-A10]|uniref:serine/threonine-protein kinase n=1 Tax=Trichocoleus desertorum TaxID=1481672 RepID=UPI0032976078